MGKEAIGGYIFTLRKARDKTQKDVAKAAGLDPSQMSRIEGGDSDPTSTVLIAMVEYLNGNYADLRYLYPDAATYADGQRLAELWIAQENIPTEEREEIKQFLGELERDGVMDIIRRLRGRQREYERWIGIGQGMVQQFGS